MVAADRKLTKLHGFRAPSDRGTCTDSVHLRPSKLHGLGCSLSPLQAARFPCNLRCTVSVHHWTTYVLTYVDNTTRHARACKADQNVYRSLTTWCRKSGTMRRPNDRACANDSSKILGEKRK